MIPEKMIEELVRDECIGGKPALKPYLDSKGILTIGIGRNLRDRGIRTDEAYRMLNNDLEDVTADLTTYLPWWEKLDEIRQRVLVNMCFNMGIKRLLGFKNMLAATERGDYATAAAEMLDSKWHHEDVGIRAERLADQMRLGS